VLGGSQGAQEINNLVWNNLAELTKTYTVVHQIGPGTPLEEINIPNPERYKPYPYIGEEMPHILVCSELVLGRSGAGTIWECAATGKPMVLIPLRGSGTRGDQVENARFFEKARAAVMLTNTDLLVKTILDLSNNRAKQEEMAKASCTVGSLDGASFIADIIQKTVKEGS
jgi:UDP-N-acetylglucosamine--N-acetylmuramyl-(pentapeptide) pyrophosphoryl-undecaprenol N-acetylglucosamine transferase